MRSMTGYGKGVATIADKSFTIEIKTVNNRYLEINSRLPRTFSSIEDALRKKINSRIKRGTVEIYCVIENGSGSGKTLCVDMGVAAEYVNAAKKLRDEFLIDGDVTATTLLRFPDVAHLEMGNDDSSLIEELVLKATDEALEALDAMRRREGDSIKVDLTEKIAQIVSCLEKVTARAPKVVTEYQAKLKTRIADMLAGVQVDEAKLLNEVAFFADKADINEEISRLSSHVNQFLDILRSDEPQGRKLDFLSQEMNREINTMGSKSNDFELTQAVLFMKNELEKIKEQIRNVE